MNSMDVDVDFPCAPLCKEQLLVTLAENDVFTSVCEFGATQEIAKYVQRRNAERSEQSPTFYAYGFDSDYFAMKDCPYIEFGTIEFAGEGQAAAVVWSRAEICRRLRVTEEAFIDIILLIGNDYTFSLMAQSDVMSETQIKVGKLADLQLAEYWFSLVQQRSRECLQAQKLFRPLVEPCSVAAKDARFRVLADLQFAIDVSRALYDLQDLKPFRERRPSGAELPADCSAPCVFEISRYDSTDEGMFFADLPKYVLAGSKIGTQGVARGVAVHALTYLKRKISAEHSVAIKSMLKVLNQPGGAESAGRDVVVPARAEWGDAQVAFVYQRTCALVMQSFPDGAFTGEHNTPVQLFHGGLFHSLLQQARTGQGLVAPLPPPTIQLDSTEVSRESQLAAAVLSDIRKPSAEFSESYPPSILAPTGSLLSRPETVSSILLVIIPSK